MKRFLYTFLFTLITVLFSTESRAQEYVPFPLSNAIWSEAFISQQPFYIETYQYGMIGDTLINSIIYHKIYRLNDTIYPLNPGQYCGAIREDSEKRIFLYGAKCTPFGLGEEEVLLYDFSKSVGDTVFAGIDGIGPAGYLIINTIDSILIENNYRKTFHFTTLEDVFWIEGIGSTRGLFSPIIQIPTGLKKWELICFNQDDEVKYLNPEYNTCFPILTSVDSFKQGRSSVRLFPHPVTGISVIEFDNNGVDFESFELYDMLGQKIKVINIIGHEQITINANDFKPGLYFFRLSGNNMNMESGKIIIK